MPWFKIDDALHAHPKARLAGLRAMGLWTLAGSWCSQQLTDGYVPRFMIAAFQAKPTDAQQLVRAGLWQEDVDGWRFKDWEEYQPSKVSVVANRRAAAARQQVARSPQLRAAIRKRDRDRCRYCGLRVQWSDRRGNSGGTYDHVIPDGPSDLSNLVVCCRGCNSAKGARTPEQAGLSLIDLDRIQLVSSSDLDRTYDADLGAS